MLELHEKTSKQTVGYKGGPPKKGGQYVHVKEVNMFMLRRSICSCCCSWTL